MACWWTCWTRPVTYEIGPCVTGRPEILHVIGSLGLGGDARNLIAQAISQARWANVSVATLSREAGPRASDVAKAGIPCVPGLGAEKAAAWLAERGPAIVWIHRNGAADANETAWVAAAHSQGAALFEYNTFGRPDATTDSYWTGHAHLSRAALLQYAERRGAAPLTLEGHTAIGYAVASTRPITADERGDARRRLGIPADAVTCLRLQRPDLRKWSPIPVVALARLLRSDGPAPWLILRAAPPEREAWIRRSCRGRCTLLPPTADSAELRATFAASDIVLNYSNIGETFGLALAEAMGVGLPGIVNSTPTLDNAQIELCRHGETGLVANSPTGLANAVAFLMTSPDLRHELGNRAAALVAQRFAPEVVDARVRAFMGDRLAATKHALAGRIPREPDYEETYPLDAAWLIEHRQRAYTSFEAPRLDMRHAWDAIELRARHAGDTLQYASSLGWGAATRAVLARVRLGGFKRG